MNKSLHPERKVMLVELLLRRFQSQYLPPAWRLENKDSSKLVIASIIVISILLFFFVFWAAVTNVEEIAKTSGEVVPQGNVRSIQHLEGGIIAEIYVKNGDVVQAGQPLLRLDPTAALSELEQMQNRATGLVNTGNASQTVTVQLNKLQAQEITYRGQLETLTRQLELQLKELAMYEKLSHTGYASQRDYLAEQRAAYQIQGEIDKVKSEYVQIQSAIAKLEDRVNRSVIQSPAHGSVHGLQLHVGNVIKPAETMLSIVPLDQTLVVEAKILTTDIGHIKVGDPVKVKIKTYDYTRYGVITGKVSSLSATTFSDDKNNTYYKGIITLDHNYVGKNPKLNQLQPGMTAEADINTGSKSLLRYLFKPIQAAISSSFHER